MASDNLTVKYRYGDREVIFDQAVNFTPNALRQEMVSIFPNPTSSKVLFTFTDEALTTELLDTAGKLVFSSNPHGPYRDSIELNAPAGVYLLRVL